MRVGLVASTLALLALAQVACDRDAVTTSSTHTPRLAVLGDSDSHSYRDAITGLRRGGDYHDVAYQWTEILARVRPEFLDQGEYTAWGSRAILARARDLLGLEAKTPRKQDFRWNYAWSGARCASLTSAWPWQARWVATSLRADPEAWADGLVLVKIGVNDLGQRRHLDAYAATGLRDAERAVIAGCAREIGTALDMIRAASPTVRVLVVGVADDSSWPPETTPQRSAEEVARIRAVLNAYDDALRSLVAERAGMAFMDDRAWYYEHFADRDSAGNSQPSSISFGGRTPVTNSQGDAPNNLMLADGHAGTVANGLWVRHLIRTLDRELGFEIPEISDADIARIADPHGEYGIAP
jgi:hypothetical protein